MLQKLYIGNLSYKITVDDIRGLFSKYGRVHSVSLMVDLTTGRTRSFAFIELEESGAQLALAELEGTVFNGRKLRISKAKENTLKYPLPKEQK